MEVVMNSFDLVWTRVDESFRAVSWTEREKDQDAYHRSSIAMRPFDAGDGMGEFPASVQESSSSSWTARGGFAGKNDNWRQNGAIDAGYV